MFTDFTRRSRAHMVNSTFVHKELWLPYTTTHNSNDSTETTYEVAK
jgi:hypothetical protein